MLHSLTHDPTSAHTATVVWLHGLGASGSDFAPMPRIIQRPDVRWVFPNAPERPVTVNGGYVMPAWYDILHMHPGPGRESETDIRATGEVLHELIDAEIARGVPPSRVVLIGFSQGGAMALHCGLRRKASLAGIAALSTYLTLPEHLDAEMTDAARSTPIFFGHGTHDDVVPMSRGQAAFEALSPGRDARWHDYPMAHQVMPKELRDLSAWLDEVVPK